MDFTDKEVTMYLPHLVRVFSDGTIQRLQNSPLVPPSLHHHPSVSSKDVLISHHPSISARLYLPSKTLTSNNILLPILLYFHGGGFFFESAFNQLHHHYFNSFVSQADLLVVSVEYRLAPETPLPAAYHDCWDALKWVTAAANTDAWLTDHGDFNRLFIGGDSAGANIVNAVALRAGSEALPRGIKVVGAFVSQPYFYGSDPMGSEPMEGHKESAPYLVWGLVYPSAVGGVDNPLMNPLARGAPSLAGIGCRKMLVCVGEKDSMRDRGVRYYEGVKKSGWEGEVELFEVEGEGHAFHIHHPESENAKRMMKRLADFILSPT